MAIPTETVYGLAADATNPSAVAAVFRAKGRPADHPVIVHLGEVDWVEQWAHSLPDGSQGLLRHFWPGPLTVILPRREGVSDAITGGQTTVGLRMPAHPLTLALLRRLGRALVAPSANRFGRISPTTAEHVRSEFGDDVAVLDGGPCRHGLESTILDLSGAAARILRPGPITFRRAGALRPAGREPSQGAARSRQSGEPLCPPHAYLPSDFRSPGTNR